MGLYQTLDVKMQRTLFAILLFSAIGCLTEEEQMAIDKRNLAEEMEHSSPMERLSIVDGPLRFNGNVAWILKDKDTESEFIVVDGNNAITMNYIPKKVEE